MLHATPDLEDPAISEAVWNNCLCNNGFSGNDLVIRDYQDEKYHVVSIIVSTAVDESEPQQTEVPSDKLVLVVDQNQSDHQVELAKLVIDCLGSQRFSSVTICPFSAEYLDQQLVAFTEKEIVICLADVNTRLLAKLSKTDFLQLCDS